MFTPNLSQIRNTLAQLGYPFYEDQNPYLLNIIGVISPPSQQTLFKDTLIVCYKDLFGINQVDYFPAILAPNDSLRPLSYSPDDNFELQPGHYHNAFQVKIGGGLKLAPIEPLAFKHWTGSIEDSNSLPVITDVPQLRIEGQLGNELSQGEKLYTNGSQYVAKGWEIFVFLVNKAQQFNRNKFSYSLIHQDDFNL